MECYVNTINTFRIDENTLFSSQLSYSEFASVLSDPAARYDTTFLTNAIANLGLQKNRPDVSINYPALTERLAAGPILKSEYADFLISTGMTVPQIESIIASYNPDTLDFITANYLNLLDAYYTQNFASSTTGSFCSIFTGLLDKLFSIFGAIKGLIDAIAQLKSIEQLLHQLVDMIKEKLLGMVQGLINQIAGCMGITVAASHQARRTSEFYSDINIKYIKDRITDIIQNMGSKFEDLIQKPETIQYLVYRLCQLASAVEQFMKAPLAGLQNLANNCFNAKTALEFNSNEARLSAVRAGAFRLSPSSIAERRDRVAARLNGNDGVGGGANNSAAYAARYITTPKTEDEIRMANEIKSATKAQLAAGSYSASSLIRFAPQVLTGRLEPYEAAGAKELSVDILVIAFRMARRMGTTLTIISGFRSMAFQQELYNNRGNSIVARPPGPHQSGGAIDISVGGDLGTAIRYASQEGAGGIGTYSWGIHVDTGNRRRWGSRNGDALALHVQDRFRTGTPPRPTSSAI